MISIDMLRQSHQSAKFYLWVMLVLSCLAGVGQTGDFILTHHSPKHSEIDNINFEITADKNGIICIANRFGVLKYDGQEWNFFKTNSSALSLAVSDDNIVYVGCLDGFGKLDFRNNKYEYISIMDSLSDHFLQTFVLHDIVYFLSDRNLYEYSPLTDQATLLISGDFLNGYLKEDGLYINTAEEEVIKVIAGNITTESNPTNLWGVVLTSPDGKTELSVDLDGGLYLNQGDDILPHPHYDRLKEADVAITDLEWVNDSLVACSTLESGVFFLHVSDSSYFEITDYHSGLPDNEIHDLYADNNQGVWVAHEFGLTRIAPLFPAYSYTNFPGLEGNLIEAQRIKDDLWINTSLGVYYFSQDTSYRSRVYVQQVKKEVQKRRRARVTSTPTPPTPTPQSQQQEAASDANEGGKKKKKRGFLNGLFKKKDRAQESNVEEEKKGFFKKVFQTKQASEASSSRRDAEDKYRYVRMVEKVVTGVSYQFHHVPGTDGKFRQLIETNDRILATSHTGIYEIDKNAAQLVIGLPIKYVYSIPNSNRLLISTERGALKHFELINDIWTEVSSILFEDVILNVYSDHLGEIWLAGTTHIYQGAFVDDVFEIQHSYEINNRYYDEISIWEHSGELYFINSQGYFKLDRENDRIIKDRSLEEELGSPHHHIHNERSRVWLYNGKIWQLLLPDGSVEHFKYLGVFPDLKYINYDEKLDRFWLITDDNQLLAYSARQVMDVHQNYSMFVKRLIGKSGEIPIEEQLLLGHDQNMLSIELLKPDYVGLLNPEYQYRLSGLTNEWSKWTHANLIDYSFLPPGEYKLEVRVRDALGDVEEGTLLNFSVATPYWQKPWFYAIQVVILAIIIGITSRLDEKKRVNRLLKHGLSILTLVVIIQFSQSVIGAYLNIESTPVVDFLIEAGIAIMVFPLEWVLRQLILEGGLKIGRKSRISKS